jgi:hypothetical protein
VFPGTRRRSARTSVTDALPLPSTAQLLKWHAPRRNHSHGRLALDLERVRSA